MSFNDSQRCMDIAFINSEKRGGSKDDPCKLLCRIVLFVLLAVFFVGIGYFAGLQAGYFAAPSDACCYGVLEFEFDLDRNDG